MPKLLNAFGLGIVALTCCSMAISIASEARGEAADTKVARPLETEGLRAWKLRHEPRPGRPNHWTRGFARLAPDDPRQFAVAKEGKGTPELVNARARGIDIATKQEFGDCTIRLEMMVAKGSNSGIYVMGEYEIQILDSFGRETVGPGDLGGIYGASAPRLNASKAPGQWQTFEIEVQAPRFAEGKKVANAVLKKVTLNGQVIHENVELKGPTPGGWTGQEAETGPLMFQGNHGPVSFRNIEIVLPGARDQ